MAVARTASASGTASGNVSTAFDIGDHANSALYVFVAERYGAGLVDGATYDGVALTQIARYADSGSNLRSITVYRLVAPASGSNTLTISNPSSHTIVWVAAAYQGVDQTTPEGTVHTSHGYTTGGNTDVTDGDSDAVVLSGFASYYTGTTMVAHDGGQSVLASKTNGSIAGGVSESPGDTSVNVGWDSSSGSLYWDHIAFAVLAAAGGSSSTPARTLLGVGG